MQNNVRGFNNFDYFCEWRTLFNSFNFKCDVIVLSEVKIKSSANVEIYKLNGYVMYPCLRNAKTSKGGLIVYVRNGIIAEMKSSSTSFEIANLKISQGHSNFHIIACYRPPESSNLNEFMNALESNFSSPGTPIALVGDFNLDPTRGDTEGKKFHSFLTQYHFQVTNSFPTRPQSGKIIDHFSFNLCDKFEVCNHTVEMDPSYTDHSMIISAVSLTSQICEKRKRIEKCVTNFNELQNNFLLSIDEIKRLNHPNDIAIAINDAIKQATNKCSIKRVFKVKNSQKISPWFNVDLLDALKYKDKLHIKFKKHKTDNNKNEYLKASQNFSALNKKLKHDYFNRKFSKEDSKLAWSAINELMGRKNKNENYIQSITSGGISISEGKYISNVFNDYFTSIPHHNACSDNSHCIRKNKSPASSFYLSPTNNEEVSAAIKSLNANSSAGIDGISPKVVQRLRPKLVPLFVHLINKIFASGIYPDAYKRAEVVPIFKNGKIDDVGNYRPVSKLSTCNKIPERVIHIRLSNYLRKFNLLSANQYGFRKSSSTENAALDVVSFIQNKLNEGKKVSAIFIDLQKAFDSVYHEILLSCLYEVGVRGTANELFSSYLSNRVQVVNVNGELSEPKAIRRGVVQGSILGPLLFLIVIDAITEINSAGKIVLYADDGVLLNSFEKKDDIEETLQNEMRHTISFLNSRKLTLNERKTVFMIFHSQYATINSPSFIHINNNFCLSKVDKFKYLGLWLDSHLKFDEHASTVETKISKSIGALWKLRDVVPDKYKKQIFNALVMSHLLYMVGIWGSATGKIINELQTAQNRGMRIVFHEKRLKNRVEMYQSNDVLPIRGLCFWKVAKFIHASLHNFTHTSLQFEVNHNHRVKSALKPTKASNNYGEKLITRLGSNMFNSLPEDIKNIETPKKFSKEVKNYILRDNYLKNFFTPNVNFFNLFKKYFN